MKRLAIAIAFACAGVGAPAFSQPATFTPMIAGIAVHCTDSSGAPVITVYDSSIGDVGKSTIIPSTGARIIALNPQVLNAMPSLLQLFFYAHECGHHLSGDIVAGVYYAEDNPLREQNADRIGIRIMRDQFNITLAQAQEIADSFRSNPGVPPYYLPGPLRGKWIVACYKTNNNNCDVDLTYSNSNEIPEDQTSSSYCEGIRKLIALVPSKFSSIKGVHNTALDWYDATLHLGDVEGNPTIEIDGDSVKYHVFDHSGRTLSEYEADTKACLSSWDESHETHHNGSMSYYFRNNDDTIQVEIGDGPNGSVGIGVGSF